MSVQSLVAIWWILVSARWRWLPNTQLQLIKGNPQALDINWYAKLKTPKKICACFQGYFNPVALETNFPFKGSQTCLLYLIMPLVLAKNLIYCISKFGSLHKINLCYRPLNIVYSWSYTHGLINTIKASPSAM